jgi:carbon monoxide dehydrogenase subunit G
MQIKGGFELSVSPQRVWDSFWNPGAMQAWLPGCTSAVWEGETRVTGEVEQSVAQLKAVFAFKMEVVEREPLRRLRLRGRGEGLTISSQVAIDMTISLEPAEGQGTRVAYVMDSDISGPLSHVGSFVLKLKAKELQKSVAASVKARLEALPVA